MFTYMRCAAGLLVVQTKQVDGRRARISVRGIASEILSEREDPVVVAVNGGVAYQG